MKTASHIVAALTLTVMGLGASIPCAAQDRPRLKEEIHNMDRPQPPKVDPGASTLPAPVPSDAIVLFGGEDLSAWQSTQGGPAPWTVKDGYFVVEPGSGRIETKQAFGDVQLHLEFATPEPATGEGQHRGNSGVFFMGGAYEVQILDSYQNKTYPDGQAAAVYGQYPPLVNASRPPGEWQSYDIIFHRARFDEEGNLLEPATMTVFHNGVLVQYNVKLTGPTGGGERSPYQVLPRKLPLELQDHDHPVRFRNIWVRELNRTDGE